MTRAGAVEYPVVELFAWVIDDPSGQHGIMGVMSPRTGLPMQAVSSRRDLMENFRPIAEDSARRLGLPCQLRRFVLASEPGVGTTVTVSLPPDRIAA